MKYRYFYNTTFKCNLHLIVNCSYESLVKKVESITGKPFDRERGNGLVDGLYDDWEDKDGCTQRFIWIKNMDWTITSMAELVHEIGHYVANVFETKGLEYCIQNQETICHFTEWLVNETFNSIKPKK
jgi:hypothetical protein